MNRKIYKKLLVLLAVFSMVTGSAAYGKEQKLEIVIFPFKGNGDSNDLAQGIVNVLRSELIRSKYFMVVGSERTYKVMTETVLSNNVVKIEDVDVKTIISRPDIVDLFSSLDLRTVIRVAEKVKADFAVKGALSQFEEKFRVDIEVVSIKGKETVSALVGECESKGKIPEMIEQLSQQIVNVCRGADINIQKEIDSLQSQFQQGLLTYEGLLDKLKKLSSEMPEVLVIHCALFSNYLGHQEKMDGLIEEGEAIVNSFDIKNEDAVKYLTSLGIDPFYELANAYIVRGRLENAMEVYKLGISGYPMNRLKYYKQLGVLYKVDDKEEDAVNAFKQVLIMDPADFDIRFKLASLYESMGDTANAAEQCRNCLKYTKNEREGLMVKEMIERLQAKKDSNGE